MPHATLILVIAALVAACAGVPLSSIPRLVSLQHQLLEADPSEFMLAVRVDERMVPPPGAVPVLQLVVNQGAADRSAISRSLPMQFTADVEGVRGLTPAPVHRRWLIYRLAPESQTELARIQRDIKQLRSQPAGSRGISLGVGIAQEGLALRDPALADTRWESWLQVARADGFFELWSGTVARLLRDAEAAAAKAARTH